MGRGWGEDEGDIPLALWEKSLENAINSKRGQAFLKELEAEMVAMKARGEGRLLRGYFIADGSTVINEWTKKEEKLPSGCCTIGVMCKAKKVDPEVASLNHEIEDPYHFDPRLPKALNIAKCLIAEIGTMNDSKGGFDGDSNKETDEDRFERMLKWVQCHISLNGEYITRGGRTLPYASYV
jgi:hypothetical protein